MFCVAKDSELISGIMMMNMTLSEAHAVDFRCSPDGLLLSLSDSVAAGKA